MKIKKETKIIKEFVFDKKEIKFIKHCLDYCYHRATKHQTIMTDRGIEIDIIRKEIEHEI